MENPIARLNKAFESRIRLGIMSALMVNDQLDFNALKGLLELTDGNLASHLKALEQAGMIGVSKQFIGRKPNTTYRVTPFGKEQFAQHLDALEDFLNRK